MITLSKETSGIQNLKGTQTEENLMRAFAGESQARNRYTFAAKSAHKNKLHCIEAGFQFTASQELAHAKVFYDFLKESNGSTMYIDGGYPVEIYDDAYSLLNAAAHNEYQEYGWERVDFIISENIKLASFYSPDEIMKNITDYEFIRNRLIVRPINFLPTLLKKTGCLFPI